jgi:hypothetical protein
MFRPHTAFLGKDEPQWIQVNWHKRLSIIFMASGLDWMGDVNATEANFVVPNVKPSLVAGTGRVHQCSCGRGWYRRFRFHGKVDLVAPHQPAQPVGTIMSPSYSYTEGTAGGWQVYETYSSRFRPALSPLANYMVNKTATILKQSIKFRTAGSSN